MINEITLITSLLATAVTAVLGFIIKKIIGFFKKIKEVDAWREYEIRTQINCDFPSQLDTVKSNLFVPTMGQFEAPHDNDISISENRFPLVEHLINEVLSNNVRNRYMIMGGSGIGKSTFSVSFFYSYINLHKFKKSPFPISILWLERTDVFEQINRLRSDRNNDGHLILILDALDENMEASKDLDGFMHKIDQLTDSFKCVIITGRTHFFENASNEIKEGYVYHNCESGGLNNYVRIYISPFSREETFSYLDSKYQVGSLNYQKAIRIIEKSDDLISRPLILTYMDDLISCNIKKCLVNKNESAVSSLNMETGKQFSSDIYMTIVDKWFDRECLKAKAQGKNLNKNKLYDLSKQIAQLIYYKWKTIGVACISESEYQVFIEKNDCSADPFSFKIHSLINRTSDGHIKFSHRSFWEFFLALNSIEKPFVVYSMSSDELAAFFSREIYQLYLNNRKYRYVDYCFHDEMPISSDFLLEDVKKCFSKICTIYYDLSTDTDSKHAKLLFGLNVFMEMLIKRYRYYFDTTTLATTSINISQSNKQKYVEEQSSQGDDNNDEKILKVLMEGLTFSIAVMDDLLRKVQQLLLYRKKDIIDDNTIKDIKFKIDFISSCHGKLCEYFSIHGMSMNDLEDVFNPDYMKKQKVAFPYIYSTREDVDILIDNSYVVLGSGIIDNNSLIKVIDYIINNNKKIKAICIYREGNDIDEHVGFICDLINHFKCIKKNYVSVIVKITINNLNRYVYIDKKMSINNGREIVSDYINMAIHKEDESFVEFL